MASSGFNRSATRSHIEEVSHADRWIVSYADFITLLFAFFVVMYSISSVNDGKFRVLAELLPVVFNEPERAGGELSSAIAIDLGGRTIDTLRNLSALESVVNEGDSDLLADAPPIEIDAQTSVEERVEQALKPLIDIEGVNVREGQQWVEVELPNELLFASGQTQLSKQALPILERMAKSLAGVDSPIRVEGFTDNIPTTGRVVSSNWQLSAVRAAAVVEQFTRAGLEPLLMSAVGYGEFHPIADNATVDGRAQNRRVVVAIARHSDLVGGKPISRQNREGLASSPETPTLKRISKLPGYLGIH